MPKDNVVDQPDPDKAQPVNVQEVQTRAGMKICDECCRHPHEACAECECC